MSKRRSDRVLSEIPAGFRRRGQEAWTTAMIVNLSVHGFCLKTEASHRDRIKEEDQIEVMVKTVEGVLGVEVRVAWVGLVGPLHCLAGGEILNPSGEDYKKLQEIYQKLLALQTKA